MKQRIKRGLMEEASDSCLLGTRMLKDGRWGRKALQEVSSDLRSLLQICLTAKCQGPTSPPRPSPEWSFPLFSSIQTAPSFSPGERPILNLQ